MMSMQSPIGLLRFEIGGCYFYTQRALESEQCDTSDSKLTSVIGFTRILKT